MRRIEKSQAVFTKVCEQWGFTVKEEGVSGRGKRVTYKLSSHLFPASNVSFNNGQAKAGLIDGNRTVTQLDVT